MDEPKTGVNTGREMRECCALIFTETWLSDSSSDSTLQLHTYSLHRGERTSASGKSRGGGVCMYVNNRWCVDVQVVHKRCSAEIKPLMPKSDPFIHRRSSALCICCLFTFHRGRTARLHSGHCMMSSAGTRRSTLMLSLSWLVIST